MRISRTTIPILVATLLESFCANVIALSLDGEDDPKSKPNIIFFVVDDLNSYPFDGEFPEIQTPHIDRFASTAITFDAAYCPAPVCVPSRAAVFSGLYPHRTGAYHNGTDPWVASKLLVECEALPECFKRNGYDTFGRGKLFHARSGPGREKGMWNNRPIHKGGFGPYPEPKDQPFGSRFVCYKAWEGPDSDFPDVRNTDAAIEFLSQEHEQPFFMTVGLWRPHFPYTAPKRFFDLYDASLIERPVGFREDDLNDVPQSGRDLVDTIGSFGAMRKLGEASWKEFLRAYFACISFVDWNFGRLMSTLEESPYARDTIVVFWSDNGYHGGEKQHWAKSTLWEKSAKTPLLIRWPGGDQAGKHSSRLVNLLDLYPTLVDLCELNAPRQALDGLSLRPLLEDVSSEWKRNTLTTMEVGYASVRDEGHRLIRYADGSQELYDHSSDPHELKNLASEEGMASIIQRLEASIPKSWAPALPIRKPGEKRKKVR